jgi:hypothetical protein
MLGRAHRLQRKRVVAIADETEPGGRKALTNGTQTPRCQSVWRGQAVTAEGSTPQRNLDGGQRDQPGSPTDLSTEQSPTNKPTLFSSASACRGPGRDSYANDSETECGLTDGLGLTGTHARRPGGRARRTFMNTGPTFGTPSKRADARDLGDHARASKAGGFDYQLLPCSLVTGGVEIAPEQTHYLTYSEYRWDHGNSGYGEVRRSAWATRSRCVITRQRRDEALLAGPTPGDPKCRRGSCCDE